MMTEYEQLLQIAQSKEQLITWLAENILDVEAPWHRWFNDTYCNDIACPAITCKYEDSKSSIHVGYCELHNKCKYFPELEGVPTGKDVIRRWLDTQTK